jgi:hypothetical protein
MSLEKSLWQRVRKGGVALRLLGHTVHLCRIENSVGVGNPDVNGCINGKVLDLELKSEDRPARASTAIHPKVKPSQSIWHHDRAEAGCKTAWVLIQVGDNAKAKLYLIPGSKYDDITAPEDDLELMSVLKSPVLPMTAVLLRAREGW